MKTDIIQSCDPSLLAAVTEPGQLDKLNEYALEPEKLYALERSGAAVGWMHLHIPDEAKYSAFVYIYVAPAYRRQGIGRGAYREAEKRIRASGCDWWSSYPPSEAADAFCRHVGFTYTNTNHRMVWHGDDTSLSDYPPDGIRPIGERDIPVFPSVKLEHLTPRAGCCAVIELVSRATLYGTAIISHESPLVKKEI